MSTDWVHEARLRATQLAAAEGQLYAADTLVDYLRGEREIEIARADTAEKRAASWWEAAKGWCRAAYTNHGAAMEQRELSRTVRKIYGRHLRLERARADAAEAKLATLNANHRDLEALYEAALAAQQEVGVDLIAAEERAVTAEAKLSKIRAFIPIKHIDDLNAIAEIVGWRDRP